MGSLRSKFNVKSVGVFGSFSRGEEKKSSDVDILVEFSQSVGMFKFIGLEEYLSKLIGKKVDLVTKNALKNVIKEDILQEVLMSKRKPLLYLQDILTSIQKYA